MIFRLCYIHQLLYRQMHNRQSHPTSLEIITAGGDLAGKTGEVLGSQGLCVGGEVVVVVTCAMVTEERQQLSKHHVFHDHVMWFCSSTQVSNKGRESQVSNPISQQLLYPMRRLSQAVKVNKTQCSYSTSQLSQSLEKC